MKKVLSNQVVLLGVALFIILTILSMRQNNNKVINQDQNLLEIDKKNRTVRQEITTLEQKTATATSDFSKEKRLRDELLLQKPGEYIVLLDETASAEPTMTGPDVTEESIWQQWRAVLF